MRNIFDEKSELCGSNGIYATSPGDSELAPVAVVAVVVLVFIPTGPAE